jgi:hypothetical protein
MNVSCFCIDHSMAVPPTGIIEPVNPALLLYKNNEQYDVLGSCWGSKHAAARTAATYKTAAPIVGAIG